MFVMPSSRHLLFLVLLLVGIMTSLTDIRHKKIYNIHLAFSAALGSAVIGYAFFIKHELILSHLSNATVAFFIGWFLHHRNMWRGGDAKLFTLYAFLMPPPTFTRLPFSGVVSLFACSFIAGTIILTPFLIKDLATNKRLSVKNIRTPAETLGGTIFLSWLLFPVYYFTPYLLGKIIQPALVSLGLTYLLFRVAQVLVKRIKMNYIIACGVIATGTLLRLWISPQSLAWPVLRHSLIQIGMFSGFAALISLTFDNSHEDHSHRVSFAPLLFIGCVLSYTPFLTIITDLLHR